MRTLIRPTAIADFYPEDIVEVNPEYYTGMLSQRNRSFFVHTTNEDGSRITGLRHITGNWIWLPDLGPDDVVLVRRGNLFKYLFNAGALRFRDLSEETMFWIRQDMTEQVRNPFTGFYTDWSPEHARDALKMGVIDAVFFANVEFIEHHVLGSAYRFSDRRVGERIRSMMLRNKNRLIPLD